MSLYLLVVGYFTQRRKNPAKSRKLILRIDVLVISVYILEFVIIQFSVFHIVVLALLILTLSISSFVLLRIDTRWKSGSE